MLALDQKPSLHSDAIDTERDTSELALLHSKSKRSHREIADTPGDATSRIAEVSPATQRGTTMQRHLLAAMVSLSLPLSTAAAAHGAPYIFTKIDVPGALSTSPALINEAGQILGGYVDSSHTDRVFLWHEGTVTLIDPPGAVSTVPVALNDTGQVLGQYVDGGHVDHGFLWHEGTFTAIDPPGALSTHPSDINDAGQIVGYYDVSSAPGRDHGFLWDDGIYTTIDALIGVPEEECLITRPYRINAAGQIIGTYKAIGFSCDHSFGFLWDNGTFTTIEGPDTAFGFTDPLAINGAGQVVGNYAGPNSMGTHAFLQDNGAFTTIDPPGSDSAAANLINATGQIVGTDANFDPAGGFGSFHNFLLEDGTYTTLPGAAAALNDAGQVVGRYVDSSNTDHAFLWDNGTFTTIDFPGSSFTSPIGINNAGEIAGRYTDSGGVRHGFLAKPAASVNGLVHLGVANTSFGGTPVPGGPAGTFTIAASFANTSSTPIAAPQFVVTQLSNGNLLLNADLPPGTAGARLTPDGESDGVLSPGESFSVEFVIGLQERRAFTFLVDLLGVPGS